MNISTKEKSFGASNNPTLLASSIPLIILIVALPVLIIAKGSDAVATYGSWILLISAVTSIGIAYFGRTLTIRGLRVGIKRSAIQILPAIPILICIAMVATTWMLSGVVPSLIYYGLEMLSRPLFLVLTCVFCSAISVFTGSSWTTIATIGVAFLGIGEVMGYSDPWIAGAIISGAYFGDKVSPLSDTTVVASSTAGVDLFDHIRYLMVTTIPAIVIALIVFLCVGIFSSLHGNPDSGPILNALSERFNITPYTLLIPLMTIILILLRLPVLTVLFVAAMMGVAGIIILQPALEMTAMDIIRSLWSGSTLSTGNNALDELVATGGIVGMTPTIFLILCAMIFGSAMIGTGMLGRLTDTFTSRLRRRTSIVGMTVASGLSMNCITADQYLSLIITGNMYRSVYRKFGLEPRLLSRAMEDSVSVTSVLIPWNSCGITQSTVLGVATLTYLPCCIFNILTPLMSIFVAWRGYKIPATPSRPNRDKTTLSMGTPVKQPVN